MENRYKYIDEGKQHLHTLDGKALIGTSSVSNVLAKPLTWWASGLAVAKFGWMNKKDENGKFRTKEERLHQAKGQRGWIAGFTDEGYLELLDEAYAAHSKKLETSAVDGTDLHAEIEKFIKDDMAGVRGHYDPKIDPFIIWADKNVKRFLWSEGHCYSEKLWTGGISDAGFEDKDGKFAVLDIKSSKDAYLSQFWQCAGYDIEISENGVLDKDGNLIYKLEKTIDYYVIFPFGMKEPEAKLYLDAKGGREAFEAEVFLYKKLNT